MKPYDLSKFRKSVTKSIPGLTYGFHDPETWISTGSYTLNYLISGDFTRGIPLGKVTMVAGDSGAGKSYIVSGNVIKEAQKQGIFVVLIDTEHALDELWLQRLGVDTSEDKMMKFSLSLIDDVAKLISDFMKDYRATYADVPREERQKVLFIIDSLGMLLTKTDVNQFESGDLKGDMGRKPKALNALVRNCVDMFGSWEVGLVCTNHSYASQDMFDPDDKISGGCLLAGTGVVMADGSIKAIEGIQIGEQVQTLYGSREVTQTWRFEKETYTLVTEDGRAVTCSPEHKFLTVTPEGQIWVAARDLREGDELVTV